MSSRLGVHFFRARSTNNVETCVQDIVIKVATNGVPTDWKPSGKNSKDERDQAHSPQIVVVPSHTPDPCYVKFSTGELKTADEYSQCESGIDPARGKEIERKNQERQSAEGWTKEFGAFGLRTTKP